MSRVSVIVPNYNHARFLGARIRSILGQTFQDFDVMVLDDASTDGSRAVIEHHALQDRRIRTSYNARNGGSPFQQWNRGVALTRGEYVWIAESDDWAEPELLGALVEKLDRHPGVGLAYAESWIVDDAGNRLHTGREWTDPFDMSHWRQDYVNSGREEAAQYLARQCTIPNASAVLVRRSAYEMAGGADPRMRCCGDWKFWAAMLRHVDVAYVARPLNNFRFFGAGASSSGRNRLYRIRENYECVGYVQRHFDVSDELCAWKWAELMAYWLSEAETYAGGYGWGEKLRIYLTARRVDPWAVGRWRNLTRHKFARSRLPSALWFFLRVIEPAARLVAPIQAHVRRAQQGKQS